MLKRSAFVFAALSLTFLACSPGQKEGSDGAASGNDQSEREAPACSESYADTWFVTFRAQACADVTGTDGAWRATSLEPDAADPVCAMRWESERSAPADVAALRAVVREDVDAMTAACSNGAVYPGELVQIPYVDAALTAGAHGCDVCGKPRRDGSILVVLPPQATFRQLEVTLGDGAVQAFQIVAPRAARAVSVTLPKPPAGARDAATRVTVY